MYAEIINGKYKIICKKISEPLQSFFEVGSLNSADLGIYCVKILSYSASSLIDYDSI